MKVKVVRGAISKKHIGRKEGRRKRRLLNEPRRRRRVFLWRGGESQAAYTGRPLLPSPPSKLSRLMVSGGLASAQASRSRFPPPATSMHAPIRM